MNNNFYKMTFSLNITSAGIGGGGCLCWFVSFFLLGSFVAALLGGGDGLMANMSAWLLLSSLLYHARTHIGNFQENNFKSSFKSEQNTFKSIGKWCFQRSRFHYTIAFITVWTNTSSFKLMMRHGGITWRIICCKAAHGALAVTVQFINLIIVGEDQSS